jgi:hypothetical protein
MRTRISRMSIAAGAAAIVLLSALSCSNPSSPAPAPNPLSTDATLSSLTLSSGSTPIELNPSFSPSKTDYAASVPFSVESLSATVVPANSGANYQISGTSGFSVGSGNTITIAVVAADNATKKTYRVTVTRGSDAALSLLSVAGYAIDPVFSAFITNYSLNVANSVSSITIGASADGGGSIRAGDIGAKDLEVGTNTFSIKVTSQDGSTSKLYKLIVSRAALPAASSNAYLSSLSITTPGATITPEFSVSTFDYDAQIPSGAGTFAIAATTMDTNADVVGDGTLTSPATGASSDYSVTVTAADGVTTKEYTLTVYRKNATLSTDSSLASLILHDANEDPIAFTPAFSSATTAYAATVPFDVSYVYAYEWSSAKYVSVVESGNNLLVGSNPYLLTVTAEDGVSKTTYAITITREGPDVSGLTVSSPGPGAVLSGDDITVAGTINGYAANIACRLIGPNCVVFNIGVSGGSWSGSLLDTTATTNGPKTLIVTPLDAEGRQSGPVVAVPVTVDNATAPDGYGSTLSGTCTFSGGAPMSGSLLITAYRIGLGPSDPSPEAAIVRALDASSEDVQDFTLTGLLAGNYVVVATYFATAADFGIAPALLGESNQVTVSGAATAGAEIVL